MIRDFPFCWITGFRNDAQSKRSYGAPKLQALPLSKR